MDPWIAPNGTQGFHAHTARPGDARQVMPHHIQRHDVLASLLGIGHQFLAQALVLHRIARTRPRALHGLAHHTVAVHGQVAFGTCAQGEVLPVTMEGGEGGFGPSQQPDKGQEGIDGGPIRGAFRAIVHLIDVAPLDVLQQHLGAFEMFFAGCAHLPWRTQGTAIVLHRLVDPRDQGIRRLFITHPRVQDGFSVHPFHHPPGHPPVRIGEPIHSIHDLPLRIDPFITEVSEVPVRGFAVDVERGRGCMCDRTDPQYGACLIGGPAIQEMSMLTQHCRDRRYLGTEGNGPSHRGPSYRSAPWHRCAKTSETVTDNASSDRPQGSPHI